jgi:phage N-6-adenine-methyltransferase
VTIAQIPPTAGVPAVDVIRGWLAEFAEKRDLGSMRTLEGRVARFAEVLQRETTTRDQAAEFLRLRLDICRTGGALLATMEKKRGGRKVTDALSVTLGIDSDAAAQQVASRWQRIAGIPHDLFVEYQDHDEPTVAGALRVATTGRLDPLMSSRASEWETPQELFDVLSAEFPFKLDVCATSENTKCARYFTAADDGLAQDWIGVCWMNPPYGKGIGAWMAKAHDAARRGATVVCLIPARTDTSWFWDHARYGEIRFLRGRLRFSDGDSAPFPSAISVLGYKPRVVWWER